jgi:hypothetical protein
MAEGKKSFVLYCDLIHTVDKLPNDKAGELFKHILAYVNDKEPVAPDLIVDITFEPIKQQLIRDLAKWHERQLVNAENGSKGGRPKKPKETENNPLGFDGLLKNPQKGVNGTVSGTENVNVTVNEKKELEISEEEIFPQNPNTQLNNLLNIQTKNQPPIAQPPLLFPPTEESTKTSANPLKVEKAKKEKKPTPYVNPEDDFHADPELNKALQMFAQDRKDRRKPMTFNAMKLNLDKLEEFSTEQLTKALYESISNGYMGVFPKKEQQNNTNIGAAHKLPEKMNYQGNM